MAQPRVVLQPVNVGGLYAVTTHEPEDVVHVVAGRQLAVVPTRLPRGHEFVDEAADIGAEGTNKVLRSTQHHDICEEGDE